MVVKALNIQAVGQPLTLECLVTVVKGITSRVDIMWSNNGVGINETTEATIYSSSIDSTVYKSIYNISQLNSSEDGSVYNCEGIINTTAVLISENNIILDIIGMHGNACI